MVTRVRLDAWDKVHNAAVAAADGDTLLVTGWPGAVFIIDGIAGDTITFKARSTVDTDYITVEAVNLANGARATTATADGAYLVVIPGLDEAIADITTYSAGTINVWGRPVPFDISAFGDVDITGNVAVVDGAPAAADVLTGIQSFTATTAATTIITVPAGRTWVGTIAISVDVAVVAASATAGQALGEVSVAGADATPTAGTYWRCEARAGANGATGTVGSQAANAIVVADVVVVAPVGNAVDIKAASTIAGTAGRMDASATGKLI